MRYTAIVPSRTEEHLDLCLPALRDHSQHLAESLVIWDGDAQPARWPALLKPPGLDVYGMFNWGVQQARTDWVLLINDDMYAPPGWDRAFRRLERRAFYTFVLVESGWMTVNARNIEHDFGQVPGEFRREAFDTFAKVTSSHKVRTGLGWYMPLLIHRALFLELGGYPTQPPFPNANDIRFFDLAADRDAVFKKIESAVYHFQCLSQR